MASTYIGKPGFVWFGIYASKGPNDPKRWKEHRTSQQEVEDRFGRGNRTSKRAGKLREKIMQCLPGVSGARIGVSLMDGNWGFTIYVWPRIDLPDQPHTFKVSRYAANPRKIADKILLLL